MDNGNEEGEMLRAGTEVVVLGPGGETAIFSYILQGWLPGAWDRGCMCGQATVNTKPVMSATVGPGQRRPKNPQGTGVSERGNYFRTPGGVGWGVVAGRAGVSGGVLCQHERKCLFF